MTPDGEMKITLSELDALNELSSNAVTANGGMNSNDYEVLKEIQSNQEKASVSDLDNLDYLSTSEKAVYRHVLNNTQREIIDSGLDKSQGKILEEIPNALALEVPEGFKSVKVQIPVEEELELYRTSAKHPDGIMFPVIGSQLLEGFAKGDYLIDERLDKDGAKFYSVSHIPSGGRLRTFKEIDTAIEIVRELDEKGISIGKDYHELKQNFRELVDKPNEAKLKDVVSLIAEYDKKDYKNIEMRERKQSLVNKLRTQVGMSIEEAQNYISNNKIDLNNYNQQEI